MPAGPDIQEAIGEKGESSTYEARDTLTSKHDEDLFDYYGKSQLAVVDIASGAVKRVGKPALYTNVQAAPDGVHVLAESLQRPYSYAVTYQRFAHEVAVLDVVHNTEHMIAQLPVADRVPVHGVPTGPRDFDWRATEPATLVWAEALDNGDWKVNVPARDKIVMQRAPFTVAPIEIGRSEQRFLGFSWGAQASLAFLNEYDENRHWRKTSIVNIDDRKQKPRVLWDLSSDERYGNPGAFVYPAAAERRVCGPAGRGQCIPQRTGCIAVRRPAVPGSPGSEDELSARLFRSEPTAYERFLAFNATSTQFLTWHESISDPPNAFLRKVGSANESVAAGEAAFATSATQITQVP